MLYREIIAFCSEIHTKHIHTLCGQNAELLNVKLVVRKVSLSKVNQVARICPPRHVSLQWKGRQAFVTK